MLRLQQRVGYSMCPFCVFVYDIYGVCVRAHMQVCMPWCTRGGQRVTQLFILSFYFVSDRISIGH